MQHDVTRVQLDKTPSKTACVIPSYRAAKTVCGVVTKALAFASIVIVVDDACPEKSGESVEAEFAANGNVFVVYRATNGGVGAATKAGIERALELGVDIIIKIDADDQMDAAYIPAIENVFEANPDLALVKGNRFSDPSVIHKMPKTRLFGNAVLSLMAKFASGYWNVLDPTNGFFALNARLLPSVNWRLFANSYFFELSVLCLMGLKRLPIAEIDMPAIYGDAPSSLSIVRVIREFPPLLCACFMRRMVVQYLLFDVNIGSASFVAGFILSLFGITIGTYEWIAHVSANQPTPTGLIMLAVLPAIIGSQLLLSALLYDVSQSPRTLRVPSPQRAVDGHDNGSSELDRIISPGLRSRVGSFTATCLSGLFVLWFCFVASRMYGISAESQAIFNYYIAHVPDVLTRIPRNLTSLALAGAFVFSAIAPGYFLTAWLRLRWESAAERLLFAVVFGLVLYTFAFLGLGNVGLLKPTPLFVLVLVCLVGSVIVTARSGIVRDLTANARTNRDNRGGRIAIKWIVSVALAVCLYCSLIQALNYEYRFDATWYHLAEARRWALHGQFTDLVRTTGSLTAALPHYQEDLYSGLMVMFGIISAKLLAWLDLPLAILAITLLTKRFFASWLLGLTAGLVFASTPIISYSAGTAGSDLPLAAVTTLAIYALMRWREGPGTIGWLLLAGGLIGYSLGVKSTGIFSLLICAALVAYSGLRSQKLWPSLSAFFGAVAIFAAPGFLQAWFWTHDPLFPMLTGLFRSPYSLSQLEPPGLLDYLRHLPQHFAEFLTLPWSLATHPRIHVSIVGPIFLVMFPATLVAVLSGGPKGRAVRYLALFVTAWMAFLNLWPELYLRYAEAIVPLIAILSTVPLFFLGGASQARRILAGTMGCVLTVMLVLNNPFLVPLQVGSLIPGKEGQQEIDWSYLYGGVPYHFEPPTDDRVIAYMNEHFTPNTFVFDDAKLYIWTLYTDPQLVEPEARPGALDLFSPGARDALLTYHVQYLVVFAGELVRLQKAPLGAHLEIVRRFKPNSAFGRDADHAVILVRLS
jgi:dolichol-phosphate mannosyltransferase